MNLHLVKTIRPLQAAKPNVWSSSFAVTKCRAVSCGGTILGRQGKMTEEQWKTGQKGLTKQDKGGYFTAQGDKPCPVFFFFFFFSLLSPLSILILQYVPASLTLCRRNTAGAPRSFCESVTSETTFQTCIEENSHKTTLL